MNTKEAESVAPYLGRIPKSDYPFFNLRPCISKLRMLTIFVWERSIHMNPPPHTATTQYTWTLFPTPPLHNTHEPSSPLCHYATCHPSSGRLWGQQCLPSRPSPPPPFPRDYCHGNIPMETQELWRKSATAYVVGGARDKWWEGYVFTWLHLSHYHWRCRPLRGSVPCGHQLPGRKRSLDSAQPDDEGGMERRYL